MQRTHALLTRTPIFATRKSPCTPSRPRRSFQRSTLVRADLNDLINSFTEAVQKSPLAEGKKLLAKMQAGDADLNAAAAQVDNLLAENPVVVFSFDTCPFCKKAKSILDSKGVAYKALELNKMGQEGYALRAVLAERTGRTSMPNIFIGGTSIGGCNDGTPGLIPLVNEGKLEAMVQAALA